VSSLHRVRVALGTAVVVLALVGCTESADDSYCETLREERRVLADLAGEAGEPGNDVLERTLESLRTLGDEAPPELDDEYTTVVNAWEALVDAVADAGIDPAEYDRKETLRELDPADARPLRQTAAALGSPRVADASAGIEDHARQVCGVDLGT
jgi:hypothetical protein